MSRFLFFFCAYFLLSLNVSFGEIVEFRFEATSQDGEVIDSVRVGDEFVVNVFAGISAENESISDESRMFAAYLDIAYDSSLVSPTLGAIDFGEDFPNGQNADFETPGIVSAIGGFGGISPPTDLENLVFRLPLQATAVGELVLTGATASDGSPLYDVLTFGRLAAIPQDEIDFGSLSLEIAEVPEPSSRLLLLISLVGLCGVRRRRR